MWILSPAWRSTDALSFSPPTRMSMLSKLNLFVERPNVRGGDVCGTCRLPDRCATRRPFRVRGNLRSIAMPSNRVYGAYGACTATGVEGSVWRTPALAMEPKTSDRLRRLRDSRHRGVARAGLREPAHASPRPFRPHVGRPSPARWADLGDSRPEHREVRRAGDSCLILGPEQTPLGDLRAYRSRKVMRPLVRS